MQQELETAISVLAGRSTKVTGAGRTDAGVHATGQVVNFLFPIAVPTDRVRGALNGLLPGDIAVVAVAEVPGAFHARCDAVCRTYEYKILNRQAGSVLLSRFVWHVPDPLDLNRMSEAACRFVGSHDFRRFGNAPKGRSTRRDVFCLDLKRDDDYVIIRCSANAFLQHMARGIVGALVAIGQQRLKPNELDAALSGEAGPSLVIAPPGGLYLVAVDY